MSKYIDLIGQKFGRLTVIDRAENYITPKGIQMSQWVCKCECGNEKVVRGGDLKKGNARSCGCLRKEKMAEIGKNRAKHGHSRDRRLYRIWVDMKIRCYNPNSVKYRLYGAEGKTVCDEWQDFEPFYEWAVSNGYDENLTIERIDGTKGYSPDNCRWATRKEQANNTRRNIFITYNGKTQTMAQWAEETGIKHATLYLRIKKLHWDIERALTTK